METKGTCERQQNFPTRRPVPRARRRAVANLNGMVGALCIALVLSLATVVRGDFRVKFEVEVRSGTKEFTVLVHEDWAPSMPPTARTPD